MEFGFDDSVDDSSRASSRTSSRSSTLVSQRSHKRRRQRESDDDSSIVSSCRISVKGAGKRASAVQDAGSFRMLRDECLDLCSTIISRQDKGDRKSLNAAVDLALLLSNKKTRSILLQNDTRQDSDDIGSDSDENFSVLKSILNAVASHTQKKSRSARNSSNPSRNRRTKSARQKQKQLSQNDSVSSAGNQKVIPTSPKMKQALACIFYFLSWDCTLSKERSVAAMGTTTNRNIARQIRLLVLQNGDALQGAVQLLFGKEVLSKANSVPSLSVASSAMQTPKSNSQQSGVAISSIHSPASLASTISSVSFREEPQQLVPLQSKRKLGDPTAAGRRKRRKQRLMQSIAEDQTVDDDVSSKKILPPPKLNCSSTDFSFLDEREAFATPKAPPKVFRRGRKSSDESTATSLDMGDNPKLLQLLSKIKFTSEFIPDHGQQDKWLSLLFLQSLNRVIEGKDQEGPSCMESDDDDDDDDESSSDVESDEESNPILLTNSLLYKSGVLPLLARAMSDSFQDVTTMLMEDDAFPTTIDWDYRQEQMSVLASLIDGACLFCESNRRAFCEEDPFSFEERNQGLLFHIFLFLDQCAKRCKTPNDKMDAIMLMGLRMLTSLTHDNEVAGEQLTTWSSQGATGDGSIRGLDILTNLVFMLEGSGHETKKESSLRSQEAYHHRYDCIVFCLNTLANIVEASDVRRLLTEIKVDAPSGKILWLEWLCQWLKIQTASFQDAILDAGTKNGQSSSQERELQKAEEDRLVAAGNSCVLLACLMMEPESVSEEPELTNTIRRLIVDQMPKGKDGVSKGAIMIVNTLKAFCNFYQLSLGDLSVAIVAPVKKLIQELQTIDL
ncbi:MAG: hypothetical protein SGBAC_006035 [Bacillariaceae sp.]